MASTFKKNDLNVKGYFINKLNYSLQSLETLIQNNSSGTGGNSTGGESQGIQGIQGLQGPRGFTGSGTQGTQGIQGLQGARGLQGSGSQGIQGVQGERGLQGLSGSTNLNFSTTTHTLTSNSNLGISYNSPTNNRGLLIIKVNSIIRNVLLSYMICNMFDNYIWFINNTTLDIPIIYNFSVNSGLLNGAAWLRVNSNNEAIIPANSAFEMGIMANEIDGELEVFVTQSMLLDSVTSL